MKNLFLFASLIFTLGCQTNSPKETVSAYQTPSHHVESIRRVFDAHGGYERWSQMNSLSYKREEEITITDLKSRKTKLVSPARTIGFDGESVWVFPDSVDASRARFDHNLYFYFYSMPFVVGDPGAYYEDLKQRELSGKTYNQLKVSYQENVGDSPDDNYIILSDPETDQMEWLMYTVTYRSKEPSEKYSLIKYDNWSEVNGLLLPTAIRWYQFQGDSVGAERSVAVFEDIEVSIEKLDHSLFEIPEGAQIAPR